MLLKIDYDSRQVIHEGQGRIILDLKYYAEFATGPHLTTVKGYTIEDFENNDALKSKTIFVGQKGGISIES